MSEDTKTDTETLPLDTWRRRRTMLWLITWFCIGVISYCLFKEPTYGEAAIESAFLVLIINTLGYVFGAVLDESVFIKRK